MGFLANNPGIVWAMLLRHLQMTGIALLVGFAIALPVGSLIYTFQHWAAPVLGMLSIVYTIPSLAMIILMIPWLGLGPAAVIAALILYTQVILVRNVVAGLSSIDQALIEVARGLGMTAWQRWWKVQFPLALPVILAGVRLAAVAAVGIAAIGAKFGSGGLGQLLFEGIAQPGRYDKIWAGAIALAILAMAINQGILFLEGRMARWKAAG